MLVLRVTIDSRTGLNSSAHASASHTATAWPVRQTPSAVPSPPHDSPYLRMNIYQGGLSLCSKLPRLDNGVTCVGRKLSGSGDETLQLTPHGTAFIPVDLCRCVIPSLPKLSVAGTLAFAPRIALPGRGDSSSVAEGLSWSWLAGATVRLSRQVCTGGRAHALHSNSAGTSGKCA